MTDWYPPPPYGQPPPQQPPPPPPRPVTPEDLMRIGTALVHQIGLLNGQMPALIAGLAELNTRLAQATVDPQATGIAGVVGGFQQALNGLGIAFEPPGRTPPKRRR